jgi:transcriptional regulator with XRE-family HTH domain
MNTPARSSPAHAVFIEELVQLRLHAGLSTQALADRLGIEAGEVERSERGRRRVDVVELQLWAFACGSSLTEFMGKIDRRTRPADDAGQGVRTLH